MEFVHGRQTNHFGTLASLWRKWINNQASTERYQQKLGTANHWRLWLCPYGRNLLGGRSWGVLLAFDEHSGFPLYLVFIENETASDYEKAIRSIEERGYTIFGIIIDGKKSLFTLFSDYQIQMCQFHMKQVIRRYLTQNPRLKTTRELKGLLDREGLQNQLCPVERKMERHACKALSAEMWKKTYTHKRLRSAIHSLDFYMPYLFAFQKESCEGMPNTNNKIEGTFTNLKKRLNVHSGMTEMSRKRLISGFFLALAATHGIRKQDPSSEESC